MLEEQDAWTRIAAPAERRSVAAGLLTPERVRLDVRAASRQAAFEAIGRLAQHRRGPTASELAARLARRDARASTAIGKGRALPHADSPGLLAPVAVYLRLREPIAFRAPDGLPVDQVLALIVPRPATAAHFELLEALMRRWNEPALRRRLSACNEPDEVCELFARHAPA